jgi:hypothetical protein
MGVENLNILKKIYIVLLCIIAIIFLNLIEIIKKIYKEEEK